MPTIEAFAGQVVSVPTGTITFTPRAPAVIIPALPNYGGSILYNFFFGAEGAEQEQVAGAI